ncbi:MAG: RND transporter [Planctomycetia bacterium]|nr:RND transporter [Planctomycetia bacterium]
MSRSCQFTIVLFCGAALSAITGCGESATTPPTTNTAATPAASGNKHETWWCEEHGVPEEVCAQCNRKLADGFKAKKDWCQKHDRPDSQCFICHPEQKAHFASLYEAKYGKQPPQPTADGAKKADEKSKEG